jgi:hypothetical protein
MTMEGRIVRKGRITSGRRNRSLVSVVAALTVALLAPVTWGAASGTVARPVAATSRVSLTPKIRLAPVTGKTRMTADRESGCCA